VRGEELQFILRQALFGEELAKVIVEDGDQRVAVMRDLHRSVGREIETEAKKDFSALLQLVDLRHFMNAKLLSARGALLASVSQGVQFRSNPAIRANEMPGGIALAGTHLFLEVRQEGVRINNHGGGGKEPF
jgi:hypothetical protein